MKPPAAPIAIPMATIRRPSPSTPVNKRRGGEPIARRTPNSRVRALTENARTPATPTIEIASATPAMPLNTMVFGGIAGVALAISIVGVAGVLAFSVSARTREFGVRLAIGSPPRRLLTGVLGEGLLMVAIGIAIGAAGGFIFSRMLASYIEKVQLPGVLPIIGSIITLLAAAAIASLLPAARAARVDVVQALRSE